MKEKQLIVEAIKNIIIAQLYLNEVDYVYDTYKKYQKMNPLIAKSNTMLADQDNIITFSKYTDKAMNIYTSLPSNVWNKDMIMQQLITIFISEYQKEETALANRLKIYDCHILSDYTQKRRMFEESVKKNITVNTIDLSPLSDLIFAASKTDWEIMRYEKIIANKKVSIQKLKKKSRFFKKIPVLIENAENEIKEYKLRLSDLYSEEQTYNNEIAGLLSI